MLVPVLVAIAVFLGGLVVLALVVAAVFRQVKTLGRSVAANATRLADAAAALDMQTRDDGPANVG